MGESMKTKQDAPEIVHPEPPEKRGPLKVDPPSTLEIFLYRLRRRCLYRLFAGRRKTESWGGLVKKGERLCLACGWRRGIKFF
jgi:hypothetical protein